MACIYTRSMYRRCRLDIFTQHTAGEWGAQMFGVKIDVKIDVYLHTDETADLVSKKLDTIIALLTADPAKLGELVAAVAAQSAEAARVKAALDAQQ